MKLIDADALLKKTINNPLHVPYITKKDVIDMPSALNNQVNLCDSCTYTYPECPSEKDDVIFGNSIGNDNICACNKYQPTIQPVATDTNVGDKISKFIDGLEEIFADIRERHVDDSVCGLCEYDGAYIGQSGNWCNECPGFNRDDCFKLSEETRKKWTEEIIKALPSVQPEPTDINAKEAVYNLAEKIGIHQLFALTVELRGEPIQPEPHEGHWIDKGWDGDWAWQIDGHGNCWRVIECSECGKGVSVESNYCPHCGARMKGDANGKGN